MAEKILFVDDEANILNSFKRGLRKQFDIDTASGGEEGLEKLQKNGPFAVVVSDMRMPGMDGAQFLAKVREAYPNTVRILLTGQSDVKKTVAAVNEGQIFLFLTKPCPNDVMVQALNAAFKQHHLVLSEKELLDKTLKNSINMMVEVLSAVFPDASKRTERYKELALDLAEKFKVENIWQLEIAIMLSQLGSVTLPPEVLKKKHLGKPLTPSEREVLNKRYETVRDLVASIPRLEEVAEVIFFQEKRYNGTGIPNVNIKEKEIPLPSRILKVIQDYDELLNKGKTHLGSIDEMKSRRGWYDPEILEGLDMEKASKPKKKGFEIREIRGELIEEGMVLVENILTKLGVVLVPKDQEISKILRLRILNFAKAENIIEPIKVLIETEEEIEESEVS